MLDIFDVNSFFYCKEIFNSSLYYVYGIEQYRYIFLFMFMSFFITCVFFIVAYILSPKELDFEKVSVYECGFEPFGEAKDVFNIQFFVVGILFMIFDLELAYLFPWVMYLGILSLFSYFIMLFFLFILVIGFIYEWKKGALDWV